MRQFPPYRILGTARREEAPTPIEGGVWYTALAIDDGIDYRFEPGALLPFAYLTTDILLDGEHMTCFMIQLQEGADGPEFRFSFGLLNQCVGRLRVPLAAVNQNRWRYEREGAVLKPLAQGARVDLAKVDRMRFTIHRKSERPVHWCMTDVVATAAEPPLLAKPLLPKGALLDEFGQSTLHLWPGKTAGEAELVRRLHAQADEAHTHRWPGGFSRWGGWMGRQFAATGFFRTHHDGARWHLVDPDGYPFWSIGMDCVAMNVTSAYAGLEDALTWTPDRADPLYAPVYDEPAGINYLKANFIRAFGGEWYAKWSEIALSLLRKWGFNTAANWSDWRAASAAGFPYTRPLTPHFPRSKCIYREMPDVFHPDFTADAADYAEQLRASLGDPAMIGYFLMNEPTWGFIQDQESPAGGMLFNTPYCATREALAGYLRAKYGSDAALAAAWGIDATLDAIAGGPWDTPLSPAARADLFDFSSVMVGRFFGALNDACRAVDPDHLNLGARYFTTPPAWAAKGMQGFDVFSINCYRRQAPGEDLARIHDLLGCPILIGEWHFGALDVGLPASGIGRVRDQEARGQAYRVYVEGAAALPWCVGAHYFTLYDQSALGRFDGENYNIGFLDVCHKPYDPLVEAAAYTHARVYPIVCGEAEPDARPPDYLPRTFL
ncbi:MAG: hypothetical protein JXB47_02115 [Anaerolineae bacterium]|nr:hypothetical protein [Anaerolineae bacterium]